MNGTSFIPYSDLEKLPVAVIQGAIKAKTLPGIKRALPEDSPG